MSLASVWGVVGKFLLFSHVFCVGVWGGGWDKFWQVRLTFLVVFCKCLASVWQVVDRFLQVVFVVVFAGSEMLLAGF